MGSLPEKEEVGDKVSFKPPGTIEKICESIQIPVRWKYIGKGPIGGKVYYSYRCVSERPECKSMDCYGTTRSFRREDMAIR